MEYLTLGYITGSFGLDGTLRILSKTQFQDLRYKKGNKILLYNRNENSRVELTVSSYRSSGEIDFVKTLEVNTKEEADALKGLEIQAEKKQSDLNEGYFYYSDLRDCKVLDANGNELGIVKEVEEFPAQVTLRVKRKNAEDFFVPFVKDFIIETNIEKKQIIINVIGGMLWKSQS